MYFEVNAGRVRLVTAVVPSTGMIVMFVIITMFYTAGGAHPDYSQKRHNSEYFL
jgi:hypothetical protein